MKIAAPLEQSKQVCIDINADFNTVAFVAEGGATIQPADGAVFSENTQLGFEAIDCVESGARSRHPGSVLTRQRNLEPASHRSPVDADPVVLWRGGAPGTASEKIAPAPPPAAVA
jgi:hypothetical protein